MNFNNNKIEKKISKSVGYIFSYFLFSTILFYVLYFTNKLPSNWDYLNVLLITILIVFIGILIKTFLAK